MNRRRRLIKRKRDRYDWSCRRRRPRYLLADLLPSDGGTLPILEEWDRLVPVGREILRA